MDLQIGNASNIFLAGFSFITVLLSIGCMYLRHRTVSQFAAQQFGRPLVAIPNQLRRLVAMVLVGFSIAFLALALMDIRWGKTTRQVPQKGIEVMFALDVSRSMLATDASPNRLDRAKQQITDMMSQMVGDRVGLVVFGGEAKQSVPLTSHYEDFKQTLETVGPHSISKGGSKLGTAIETAADGFLKETGDHKAIVLFTDGEDQESQPVELAKDLFQETGIRVFTVGLGDFEQGSRIPTSDDRRDQFLTHRGEQVWSKLNGTVLQAIATETNGAYIPAGTKQVDMAEVYHSYIANVEQAEFETAEIDAYTPRYQWFAGVAFVLLILEVWVTTLRRDPARPHKSNSPRNVQTSSSPPVSQFPKTRVGNSNIHAAVLLATLVLSSAARAQTAQNFAESINQANQWVRDQKLAEAIDLFSEIVASDSRQQEQLDYNLAIAHYRNRNYDAANSLFSETAKSLDSNLAANSRYNLGNGYYAQGLENMESDPQSAINLFKTSIKHFRSSLRLNRDNPDARVNIELANKAIQELQQDQEQQDQEQQDQEQQDQEQQDQEQQDQQQQDQQQQDQQQQDQQQQDQQQQDQQQQDQQQQDQQQQDQQQQDQQQQDQQQQDQQQQDQQQQDQQQQDQQQQDQQLSNEKRNRSDSGNDGEKEDQDSRATNGESDDSTERQPTDGELTTENQSPQDETETQPNPEEIEQRMMTKEEALKMLQSVRDRDLMRRLRRLRRERSRRVPVERDW